MEVRPHRVPCAQGCCDTVCRFLYFRLESAEELVPNDQGASVVPVKVFRITAVMYPVVTGCVEQPFKGSHAIHGFGVYPKLVQGVNGRYR